MGRSDGPEPGICYTVWTACDQGDQQDAGLTSSGMSYCTSPDVLIKDVLDNLKDLPYSQFAKVIRGIHEPKVILVTQDMISNSAVWIVGPSSLPDGGELVQACGQALSTDLGRVILIQSFEINLK